MRCEKCKGKGRSPVPDSEKQPQEVVCSVCNGTGRKGRFIKINGTGKCPESHDKKHKFIMTSFPNPEYWGDKIAESFYEFKCWYCSMDVSVPYEEAQKERISVSPAERSSS